MIKQPIQKVPGYYSCLFVHQLVPQYHYPSTIVPQYHSTKVPYSTIQYHIVPYSTIQYHIVPQYHSTIVPYYHSILTIVPQYRSTLVPQYHSNLLCLFLDSRTTEKIYFISFHFISFQFSLMSVQQILGGGLFSWISFCMSVLMGGIQIFLLFFTKYQGTYGVVVSEKFFFSISTLFWLWVSTLNLDPPLSHYVLQLCYYFTWY